MGAELGTTTSIFSSIEQIVSNSKIIRPAYKSVNEKKVIFHYIKDFKRYID